MLDDDRVDTVKRLLFDYVKSPSLRHIKDPYMLIKLAQDIVKKLDRGNSAWTKWNFGLDEVERSSRAARRVRHRLLDPDRRPAGPSKPHGRAEAVVQRRGATPEGLR
jgi:hypothetical protein